MKAVVLLCLLGGAAATAADRAFVNRQVGNVVDLLKNMVKGLDKDEDSDQKAYDKMSCWCKNTKEEKSKAIKEAEDNISRLSTAISSDKGKSGSLEAKIEQLDKDITSNKESADAAAAISKKALADFNAREKDLLTSITSLKSAITVMSKHHPNPEDLVQATNLATKLKPMFSAIKGSALLAIPQPGYSSQSGEIFGILNNMADTFKNELEQSRDDEKVRKENYNELSSAKAKELKNMESDKASKEEANGAAKGRIAADSQEKDDTSDQMAADQKTLGNTIKSCDDFDKEFGERTTKRANERQAVSKALEVLNSDENRDLFGKSLSLIQTRSDISSHLTKLAATLGSKSLLTVAQAFKSDAWDALMTKIGDLIKQKQNEQQDEVDTRDQCLKDFHENKMKDDEANANKDSSNANLESTKSQLSETEKKQDNTSDDKKEAEEALKKAGENRAEQNLDYQETMKNLSNSKAQLEKALRALEGFYKDSLLQQKPAGFDNYKKQDGGGGGVIGLINNIISECERRASSATNDEEKSQADYEEFSQDTNDSIDAYATTLNQLKENHAGLTGDKATFETEVQNFGDEVTTLANVKGALEKKCNFLIDNFTDRQKQFDAEIQSLQHAKTFLSSPVFKRVGGSFLQRK